MMMEKLVERLAGETEVLGKKNLLQCRFVHHKPHMLPGGELWQLRWEASDQRLELQHRLMSGLCFSLATSIRRKEGKKK
jgi:hypothetical protein